MINEFAIPQGSRLYFGKTAKKKREIENKFVEIFYRNGFEEILTPYFSYYQTLANQKEIITFSDTNNNKVSLRADSAQDIVRLITKRLGRSTEHKKWFYVQPVFKYPTTEKHQVGAEWIENKNISEVANLCSSLLSEFEKEFFVQIGNIKIPQIISNETGIDIKEFESHNIELLSSHKIAWLDELIKVSFADELLMVIDKVPDSLKTELKKLYDSAKAINSNKVIATPIYHAQLEYYDELFFRCIHKNKLIAMGGNYQADDSRACGFAIYTDELISE
ncbi:MAG: histidyl-tRNA synthetase [Campylobacterota bacterium]|nr:histidyl-tRNA synthetase [Campylobacterota bacterium]